MLFEITRINVGMFPKWVCLHGEKSGPRIVIVAIKTFVIKRKKHFSRKRFQQIVIHFHDVSSQITWNERKRKKKSTNSSDLCKWIATNENVEHMFIFLDGISLKFNFGIYALTCHVHRDSVALRMLSKFMHKGTFGNGRKNVQTMRADFVSVTLLAQSSELLLIHLPAGCSTFWLTKPSEFNF